jgi:flagellar protein FlaG
MEIRPTSNIVPTPPLFAPADPAVAKAPADAVKEAGAAIKLSGTPQQASAPSKEDLAQALKSINSVLQDRSPGLEFSIDSASDRAVVKVVDKDTHEVIRQMPSREAMEIAQALDKLHSLMARQTA